ncbi:hypothetical protein TUM4261_34820 [Shewanella sp. c952]|nr:hypothetical protein TUM4261_34820 [Shewanella sp. c952]
MLEIQTLQPNDYSNYPSADTAATVHDMDVMAELPWMDLLRVTAVSTHAIVHSHLTHRDMGNVIMV